MENNRVLEYARSRGIARDHQQIDPLSLLANIPSAEYAWPLSVNDIIEDQADLASSLNTDQNNEKFVLGKDAAKFLSSVLRDADSVQHNLKGGMSKPIAFENFSSELGDNLKLSVPLLTTAKDRYLKTVSKRAEPEEMLDEIAPRLADRERKSVDEGVEFPDYFWELPEIFDRDPRAEKLEASKETVEILHRAMRYVESDDNNATLNRLTTLVTDSEIFSVQHLRPLYIESEEQKSSPCNLDVEEAVKNVKQRQDGSLHSEKADTEASLSQQASSPSIDRVEKVANTCSPTGTASSKISLSGPMDSLTAFMQTRCHHAKRRKVDNTSRYFESTPNKAANIDSKRQASPKSPANTIIPSPPALHNIRLTEVYPRSSSEESNAPLTMVISAHMLRTDSELIRSLENFSSSRRVRLVFREYTGVNPTQAKELTEADLTVSCKTGIILVRAHETTQHYLPGQGPPGMESPLQTRIAWTAPRYETLYVLVQSPEQIDAKTLSSIRSLSSHCMALAQVCTINTLLVTGDHVLKWITSIATKHLTDTPSTVNLDAVQDEQSQWEVFLRKAGLNSFAAQCVIGLLRTQVKGLGHLQEKSQGSALSKFVEMHFEERRDMFLEILGQRVLSRAEKALETDWQVEWAVNLSGTEGM